jgi:hypothetical protein
MFKGSIICYTDTLIILMTFSLSTVSTRRMIKTKALMNVFRFKQGDVTDTGEVRLIHARVLRT